MTAGLDKRVGQVEPKVVTLSRSMHFERGVFKGVAINGFAGGECNTRLRVGCHAGGKH